MRTEEIRVFYPPDRGSLSLRTEHDWNADVSPGSQSGAAAVFHIKTDRPFFYFKPVIAENGSVRWSRGENFLATSASDATTDVYPYFNEDARCSVCQLMAPLASPAGVEHRFRVFLPPGYHENTLKRYPVLYMHDGNNLFLKEEAFLGNTWKTDEVLNVLNRMNACDGVIVVGVHPRDRMTEYTQPGYEDYGRFLTERLKPLIDEKYRTLRDPNNTAVMGSSLGGVVSFYLGWQWPEVFGKVACLSSTFGFRDDFVRRITEEPARPIKIYLDSGWPGDNYEPTRALRDLLIWKGYQLGTDLFYLAFPNAAHNEEAWSTRSHIPFQFLHGKTPRFAVENSL